MKKLFSILFAAMFLFSGMHLTLASHICGGELAAVKWSFSGEKASCGMETDNESCPLDDGFRAACCQDHIASYTVDNNYNASTIQINEPVNQLLQVFYIPESVGILTFNTGSSTNTNVRPPGKFNASAVNLSDICIFRI